MQKYCKFAVLLVNIKGNALGFDEYLSTSTERPDIRYLGVCYLVYCDQIFLDFFGKFKIEVRQSFYK